MSYKFLRGPREALVELHGLKKPFEISDDRDEWDQLDFDLKTIYTALVSDDPTGYWDELDPGLKAMYEELFSNEQDRYITRFTETSRNLISGLVQLINFLIEKKKSKEEVQTLVFLDKSARNGAYMLYVAWDIFAKSLEKQNPSLMPKKPNIRFLNVGRSEDAKHNDESANQQLSRIYSRNDFLGHVLIIDEIISTGGSIRAAGESLLSAGYNPSSLEGIANFSSIPDWYSNSNVKGITDVGYISQSTRDTMANMDEGDREQIIQVIRQIGWQELVNVCVDTLDFRSLVKSMSIRRRNNIRIAIDLIRRYASQALVSNEQVIRYLASSGGFLGLSPNKESKQLTSLYRTMLKRMIRESFARKLVRLS